MLGLGRGPARLRALLVVPLLAAALAAGGQDTSRAAEAPPGSPAPQVTQAHRVAMSDGVEIYAQLVGRGPTAGGNLPARPLIVEVSPYGEPCCSAFAGPEYNHLFVHIRGTGHSDGAFDALGDRTQHDIVEVLDWACRQPFSNGRIGLFGFSASAIAVYNSLHLELPCVETAVLGAGTHELYRDLMYPGGIPNLVPALAVLLGIGAPSVQAGAARLERAPATIFDTLGGMVDTAFAFLEHPTLDSWWRERGMRGDVNDLPILMFTGFFDVESRGPFETFQELREDGSHLLVIGAHDGAPEGSGGADPARQRWFDRHLRDVDNGVDREPPVQLWLADGSRAGLLAGDTVRVDGDDWPLPGTQWASLHLDPERSGTATSMNDGTLSLEPARTRAAQPYVAVPTLPTATDPHTVSTVGVFNDRSALTDTTLFEPLGLSYTTAPLASDVVSAGPASLDLLLSTSVPGTDVYAVVSDVWPDGSAHPVATGRLRTTYPRIDEARSRRDSTGAIVQPYGRYDAPHPAGIGETRRYHVELWPIGNRFKAGHRIRLHIVGASAFHVPSIPAVNTVYVGGPDSSRLLLPVVPGSALPTE